MEGFELNYAELDTVEFFKGTDIDHDMYKDIQFFRDKKNHFYQVVCTKHDNSQCHLYIGFDGADARRTYNRIIAASRK